MDKVDDVVCSCGEFIVKSLEGKTKVRSKILLFEGGKTLAKCRRCGGMHEVPIQMHYVEDNVDNIIKSKKRRVYVRNNLTDK